MPGNGNSKRKGAWWERMGSVRETARRQCGWRRVNAREKEKERDRDRDRDRDRERPVGQRGGHRHCLSLAPSFSHL